MRPNVHILFGIFFAFLIYFIFPQISLIGLLIVFFSSVLIDVDHYFYYFIRTKNLNLTKCYGWYDAHLRKILSLPMSGRKKVYTGFYIFHGIEPLIVLFFLGISVSQFFMFTLTGFLLHWIIDTPHEYYIKRTLHKISLIYSYTQWKKLEK
ncbi:MAG: hypothetical protein AABW47_03450 [Nanoarchaeota archaeon]